MSQAAAVQSGFAAGAVRDRGDGLDEERPDDEPVGHADRRPGPQAVDQTADPEHEHGRRGDVQAGLDEVAEPDGGVLRRGPRQRPPRR